MNLQQYYEEVDYRINSQYDYIAILRAEHDDPFAGYDGDEEWIAPDEHSLINVAWACWPDELGAPVEWPFPF